MNCYPITSIGEKLHDHISHPVCTRCSKSATADEARVGQKNKITRRWAKRGSRPSAPHDQRTASTYQVHRSDVAAGQDDGCALAVLGADGAEDIGAARMSVLRSPC